MSTHLRVLTEGYPMSSQHDRVKMVSVLRTKVASALEGLTLHEIHQLQNKSKARPAVKNDSSGLNANSKCYLPCKTI